MRILLLTSMVPDPHGVGAIPKLLDAQLRGLTARHQVTLLASYGEDPGQAEAARRLLASDLDAHLLDRRRSSSARRRWGVRAELAASWLRHDWPWRVVCGSAGLQAELDRLLWERSFDVVAVEDNPVAVLRFPANLPVVFTEHEAVRTPASEWTAGASLRERPLRALRRVDWRRWERFLPALWRRFDLVQVFSPSDAEELARRAPEAAGRVRVNPYGIDPPPAADGALEEPGTVLFTGTFGHLPNRDAARWLAKEIMPALRTRAPGAVLRLAGAAPPAEVRELAGPGVEVIPDPESMDSLLARAAVVAAPVRGGGGMRMKVLEAMARGKAVVTTPLGAEGFGCFDEPVPLAIATGREEVSAAIADLLDERHRREALGQSAREFALRHHSPAAWAQRLELIYAEARALRRP